MPPHFIEQEEKVRLVMGQRWGISVKSRTGKFLIELQHVGNKQVRQLKSNQGRHQQTPDVGQVFLAEIKPRNENVIITIKETQQHAVGHNVL